MKRYVLAALGAASCLTGARAEVSEENKATVAYVQGLQTPSGGFMPREPAAGQPKPAATLRATSSAVRALHYLGAEVPNRAECIKFVESCYDNASGGFADTPGGKPDVFTTAVGAMAVAVLKMPLDKYADGVTKYLEQHVQNDEDVRIAVAGLERLEKAAPAAQAWRDKATKQRNADGTYGKEEGVARATATAFVTLARLGQKAENPAALIKHLKEGQRNSGGFGKEDAGADLETTYRVMRAFVMLKERPADVSGLRSFVAKCRNEDGGFSNVPGETSTVSATYFAAIVNHWLDQK